MALAAAQVVTALAARLAAQSTLGAGGVKTSRTWPWEEADLPACRIYAVDEQVDLATQEGINQHLLSVDAQYTVKDTLQLDDAMHAQASAGLALLFAGVLPYGLQLTGITRQTATEGESAVGQITLQLRCQFYVAPSAPETIIS